MELFDVAASKNGRKNKKGASVNAGEAVNPLRGLLVGAGERMAIDLREDLVRHRGERGRGREESVRQFLRRHVPRRFEISDGFAFDFNGEESDQLDIVIANLTMTPQLQTQGGIRLFPIESVVGVGQVKTKVTSEREFFEALDNLASVGALDRSAGGAALAHDSDEPLDHTGHYLDRVFTFLFIAGRTLSGERMRELLLDYCHGTECHQWPNVIISPDRFVLTFCCDDGPCPNTMHARGISLLRGTRAQNLVLFYFYLVRALEVTRVASVPYHAYLKRVTPPAGDTIYAATNLDDEPPPFLNSLIWLSNSEHEQRREKAHMHRGKRI